MVVGDALVLVTPEILESRFLSTDNLGSLLDVLAGGVRFFDETTGAVFAAEEAFFLAWEKLCVLAWEKL